MMCDRGSYTCSLLLLLLRLLLLLLLLIARPVNNT